MGDAAKSMPQIDNDIVAGGKIVMSMGKGPNAPALCMGSGAPTLKAPQGSVYYRSDGSTSSTRQYMNSDGGTTWVAVTTAS